MSLIYDSLLERAKTDSDKIAVICKDKKYTYKKLLNDSYKISISLTESGIKPGDRVAIYRDNSYITLISIYGALLAGATFIVINPQTKLNKVKYYLENSEASALLAESKVSSQFLPLLDESIHLKVVISDDKILDSLVPGKIFSSVLDSKCGAIKLQKQNTRDLASLVYTSGSTGTPKGVMMSHANMTFIVDSVSKSLRLESQDRILNTLPMAFGYGLYQIFLSVYVGGTLILDRPGLLAGELVNLVEKYEPTTFPGVPVLYRSLVELNRKKNIVFKSIKKITNAAAALSPELLPDLMKTFPNAQLFKMYGLTECKRVCYLEPELLEKFPSSVGKAIPGTELFLRSKDGERVPTGEIGILYVRGPHIMQGYWNDESKTNHMLKKDIYPGETVLCTHDWFKMDKNGLLYFQARSDEMIKTRGEKVSPVEIENCLYAVKGIRDVAVVGVKNKFLDQEIHAFISLEDKNLELRTIKKHCKQNLESFMIPRFFHLQNELPKTTSGKIKKSGLASQVL